MADLMTTVDFITELFFQVDERFIELGQRCSLPSKALAIVPSIVGLNGITDPCFHSYRSERACFVCSTVIAI